MTIQYGDSISAAPLRWILPDGIQLAYSTAADGDQRQAPLRQAWLGSLGLARPCVVPAQVHGALIADGDDPAALAGADGVVAARGGVVLGVFGADCPGLCLAAPDAFGLAHCGWRGTAAGIVASLAAALRRRSRHGPERWQAFIGPGIAGDRYEVDGPVLAARTWPAEATAPTRPGHAHLDLAAAIAADCRALGIVHLTASAVRTGRDPRLHSYRHRGPGLVQMLAAWVA
jgi:copper oxidase (laccase) domain-containing protein